MNEHPNQSLLDLPSSFLVRLFCNIKSYRSVLALLSTCRSLRTLGRSSSVWIQRLEREYGLKLKVASISKSGHWFPNRWLKIVRGKLFWRCSRSTWVNAKSCGFGGSSLTEAAMARSVLIGWTTCLRLIIGSRSAANSEKTYIALEWWSMMSSNVQRML